MSQAALQLPLVEQGSLLARRSTLLRPKEETDQWHT